jgi:Domain of unknown function (DUF5655)
MSTPLWRCPECGQTFVARNMPHSCSVVGLDAFFERVEPALRELFDRFVAAAAASGPVTVNATKSRVSVQARMRFAGIERPRKRHLVATFVLTTPVRSPRIARVEYVEPYYYVHRVPLRAPSDVDDELRGWLAQAYQVGVQRHVTDPGWPKLREPPEWLSSPCSSRSPTGDRRVR